MMEKSMYELKMHTVSPLFCYFIVHQVTGPRFFSKWMSFLAPSTTSIDTFHVQDKQGLRQYVITTSDRSKNVSIHKITRKGMILSHTEMIPGAITAKTININNTVYIAVACNSRDDTETDSQLYTWTNDGTLEHVQTFSNNEANDVTFGTTTNDIFLTLTTNNERSDTGVSEVPSKVYKWDPKHRLFNFFQSLETICGVKSNFFNGKGHLWLSIACQYNDSIIINSFIYRWNGSRFELFQAIPSPQRIKDLHPVNIGNHLFLIAVIIDEPLVVYKLSNFTGRFEVYQTIQTLKNVEALDSFFINGEYFISALSSLEPLTDANYAKLIIYKFNGPTYNFFQSITINPEYSVKVFRDVLSESWLMGIANGTSVDLYKWNVVSNN